MNKYVIDYFKHAAHNYTICEQLYHDFLTIYNNEYPSPTHDPKDIIQLSKIIAISPVLASFFIYRPSWINDILYQNQSEALHILTEKCAEILICPDEKTIMNHLRLLKYKELTRLLFWKINQTITINEELAYFSQVADSLIQAAYNYSFHYTVEKYGKPLLDDAVTKSNGCIIGLGKLGSSELNYSSDIDLLIIYDSDQGAAKCGNNSITLHEFYVHLTHKLTQILSHVTPDGFVFRVDHELRPEGNQGPLANSFDAALRYYQHFGQNWERQCLIRARSVAGNIELGNTFIHEIKPFVYRRSISISDLKHLQQLKERIEVELLHHNEEWNIKLGAGGIREIEFFIQALQQLYGGKIKSIQTSNTLAAVNQLTDAGIITHAIAIRIKKIYLFYRNLENIIQIENDRQIHCLPKSKNHICQIAYRIDPASPNNCEKIYQTLQQYQKMIRHIFQSLFKKNYKLEQLKHSFSVNLSTCNTIEERIDSIVWMKNQEHNHIEKKVYSDTFNTHDILQNIALVADAFLHSNYDLSYNELYAAYGHPMDSDNKVAGFAILGMGRLGSKEIDFQSDLDLCFIYSKNGSTNGAKQISNVEFFTKLAQRIISKSSMITRYGRAYQVDSELRPSGNAGTLIASWESFVNYHQTNSQLWEKMAMLKSRIITGETDFIAQIKHALQTLVYDITIDETTLRSDICYFRQRILDEAIKSNNTNVFNLKLSPGGLKDLETIIQFFQLRHMKTDSELWHSNTFLILSNLYRKQLIDKNLYTQLDNTLIFYRTLMLYLRLLSKRCTNEIKWNSPLSNALAQLMGCNSSSDLQKQVQHHSEKLQNDFNLIIDS